MTLGMAIMTVIIRRHSEIAVLPAVGLSPGCARSLPSASRRHCRYRARICCSAWHSAFCQNASGLALYAIGSRRVPAAEATFLAALEVPLTPLWVWAILGETPSAATLLGGAIVLSALFGHIILELRSIRPSAQEAEIAPH